ncbi:MAG: AAA family ATPase, partial [Tissierellia bacterium]|nr:AAA family ATPase [Tissierellia bacterium]MDD4726306.1 AAA family ATPase [Tissierellia bacterium]
LIMDTKVLLLDEPTSGLDPAMSEDIKEIVKELSQEKKLIISSHDMDFIYEVCDYIYILSQGKVIREGITQGIFLEENLLKKVGLDKPWLVKIHEYLNLPLYKNEKELKKSIKKELIWKRE